MNNVSIIGRLVRDLELKETNSKRNYVRFTVAVNRGQDDADFIDCVAWDDLAVNLVKFNSKGSQIGVSGSIRTGSYEKDNKTIYTTDIVAHQITFLTPKTEEQVDEVPRF